MGLLSRMGDSIEDEMVHVLHTTFNLNPRPSSIILLAQFYRRKARRPHASHFFHCDCAETQGINQENLW